MFTSWKSRGAVLAVAATMAVPVLCMASPAGAAKAGTNRPYNTTTNFSAPYNPSGPIFFAVISSEKGTHIGAGTYHEVSSLASDVVTETAANGDTIVSSPVSGGLGTFACPADGVPLEGEYTITGGTGRFAGATGSFLQDVCLQFVSDPSSPTGFTISETITSTGKINY